MHRANRKFRALFEFVEPYAATRLDRYYLASWAVRRNPGPQGVDAGGSQIEVNREELDVVATQLTSNLGDDEALTRLVALEQRSWYEAVQVVRSAVGPSEEDILTALEEVGFELLNSTLPANVAHSLSGEPGVALRPPASGFLFVSRLDEWMRFVALRSLVDHEMRVGRNDEWLLRERARHAVADLLREISRLPDRQRMSLTLAMSQGDERPAVRRVLLDITDGHAREGSLAGRDVLFPLGPHERLTSDAEIAAWLTARDSKEVTAQSVAANRSIARRRLSDANPAFGPMLDIVLPYRKAGPPASATEQQPEASLQLATVLRGIAQRNSMRLFQAIIEEDCPRFDLMIPLYARAQRLDDRSGLPVPVDPAWRGLQEHLVICERCNRTTDLLLAAGRSAAAPAESEEPDASTRLVQRALARLLSRPDLSASMSQAVTQRLRYQDTLDSDALDALRSLAARCGPGARSARTAIQRQAILHPELGGDARRRITLLASPSRGSRPVVVLQGAGASGRLAIESDALRISLHGLPRELEAKRPSLLLVVDGGAGLESGSIEDSGSAVSDAKLDAVLSISALPGHDLRALREVQVIAPAQDPKQVVLQLAGESKQAAAHGRVFEALAYAGQELRLRQAAGPLEIARIGGTHRRMGELHRDVGNYDESRLHLERAQAIAVRVADRGLESDAGRSLAELHLALGQREPAIAAIERAHAIASTMGDAIRVATLLVLRARAASDTNQHAAAARDAHDAATLFRSAADPVGRAAAYNVLALAMRRAGDLHAADQACSDAEAALAEPPPRRDVISLGDPRWRRDHRIRLRGEVASSRGRILHSQGRFEQSLECFEVSLLLMYQAGSRRGEANAVAAMGRSLEALGRSSQALRLYLRAREIFRVIGETPWAGVMAGAIARLRLARAGALGGDAFTAELQEALVLSEEAFGLRRGDPRGEAIALTTRARIKAALAHVGRHGMADAIEDFERALSLRRECMDPRGEAHTLSELALVLRPRQARGHLVRALELHRETGDRRGEVTSLARLGSVSKALGQRDEAERHWRHAIAIIETIRASFVKVEYRQSYMATVVHVYHALAQLLAPDDPARSLEAVDAARARGLVDRLGADRVPRRFVPGEWMQNYSGAALLDEGTAALIYLLGDPVLVYVLTSDGVVVQTLHGDADVLARQIDELRDDLLSGVLPYRHGRSLFETLIEPARQALGGRTSLLLSLDGALHRLPFALLLTREDPVASYLIRDYSVTIVPSLTSAAAAAATRSSEVPSTHLLAIGAGRDGAATESDPAGEAAHVARLVEQMLRERGIEPTIRCVLGTNALPGAVESAIAESNPLGILHFAAETIDAAPPTADEVVAAVRAPELLLARDTVWSSDAPLVLRDRAAPLTLRIRAALVVLSADGTAVGSLVPGEGVISLARAFLAAGADAICATILPIIGDSAVTFAGSLYEGLLGGAPLAEAIGTAQIVMADGGHSPLHWAGWAAYGSHSGSPFEVGGLPARPLTRPGGASSAKPS